MRIKKYNSCIFKQNNILNNVYIYVLFNESNKYSVFFLSQNSYLKWEQNKRSDILSKFYINPGYVEITINTIHKNIQLGRWEMVGKYFSLNDIIEKI